MSDLRQFHTAEDSEELESGSATPKIIGAAVVALAVIAAGGYSYESGMWKSQTGQTTRQMVASKDLPSPPALPRSVPDIAPPPAPAASDDNSSNAAQATEPAKPVAPVHTARVRRQEEPAAVMPSDSAPAAAPQPVPATPEPAIQPPVVQPLTKQAAPAAPEAPVSPAPDPSSPQQ